MKKSIAFVAVFTALQTLTAGAASVDMKDPRRAVGREENIRVDAILNQDTVSSSSSIGVTYQIENLTDATIAIADKMVDVSYDVESRTITFSIGSEVPNATMPHLVVIAPGEKRVLTAGGILVTAMPRTRSPWAATPRLVQIKVNVLRDARPFVALAATQPISDAVFDQWVDRNESILLNSVPVRWRESPRGIAERASAEHAGGSW